VKCNFLSLPSPTTYYVNYLPKHIMPCLETLPGEPAVCIKGGTPVTTIPWVNLHGVDLVVVCPPKLTHPHYHVQKVFGTSLQESRVPYHGNPFNPHNIEICALVPISKSTFFSCRSQENINKCKYNTIYEFHDFRDSNGWCCHV
jgi:hypothetical protein